MGNRSPTDVGALDAATKRATDTNPDQVATWIQETRSLTSASGREADLMPGLPVPNLVGKVRYRTITTRPESTSSPAVARTK